MTNLSFTFKKHFEGNFSIIFKQKNVYEKEPLLITINIISFFQLDAITENFNRMHEIIKSTHLVNA